MSTVRTTFDSVLNPQQGDPQQGGGYWVNLDTMALIRERCEDRTRALAVFFALNLLATDFKTSCFHVTHDHIGKLSGLNASWVSKTLASLADVGVITCQPVRGASAIDGLVEITLLGEVRLS